MLRVKNVCMTDEEVGLVFQCLNDFSVGGPRETYAVWLEQNGMSHRSPVLRSTMTAYANLDVAALIVPSTNPYVFSSEDKRWKSWREKQWLRLMGVTLLEKFLQAGVKYNRDEIEKFRNLVFPMIRPALSMTFVPAEKIPNLSESYLWGEPALPRGTRWPTVADASNEFDARKHIPQEKHCAFVGQFNMADFAGSLLAHTWPADGMFSIFSFSEKWSWGVREALISAVPSDADLERLSAPNDLIESGEGFEENEPQPYHDMIVEEEISLPSASWGVFAEEIPECGFGKRFHDLYEAMLSEVSNTAIGFGGYLQATTGADPSPGRDWERLVVLRPHPETDVIHFGIQKDALEKADFNLARYVWMDLNE